MSDFKPLGKPIPEKQIQQEDEWERVNDHGTILRNKRTGQLRTSITPKGPQYAPTPQPEVHIYSAGEWDALIKQLQKQRDDGFPIHEWGVL
jgi:hypothetical protein